MSSPRPRVLGTPAPTPDGVATTDAAPASGGLPTFEGVVQYGDGRVESFTAGSAIVAEWELYALRNGYPVRGDVAPPVLFALYVAFAALGGQEGFETWRRDVLSVRLAEADAPPIPPAPTAG